MCRLRMVPSFLNPCVESSTTSTVALLSVGRGGCCGQRRIAASYDLLAGHARRIYRFRSPDFDSECWSIPSIVVLFGVGRGPVGPRSEGGAHGTACSLAFRGAALPFPCHGGLRQSHYHCFRRGAEAMQTQAMLGPVGRVRSSGDDGNPSRASNGDWHDRFSAPRRSDI